MWGERYLFGTPNGLFQLEDDGRLSRVIKSTKFYQITVLEDYGVLMAICGRHRHIRMYKLDDLFDESRQQGAFTKKEPFVKLKNTKYSSHYSTGVGSLEKNAFHVLVNMLALVVRVRSTTFLVAAVKTAVILFMWAEFPFNQFMKIKDFYVPEPALCVEAVVSAEGKVVYLAVQCPSRFVIINVETNEPIALEFSSVRKSLPLLMQPINNTEILMVYQKCGVILDMTTLQPKRVIFNWRLVPVAAVPMQENMILAFNPKMIDVFSKHNGEIIQTIRHKESKKIRYLMTNKGDVIVATRSGKPQSEVSSVYILRSGSIYDRGEEV